MKSSGTSLLHMVSYGMAWPQELLVNCQPQNFLEVHFPEVSALQVVKQKISELREDSCNHFETHVLIIQDPQLSSIHPTLVIVGPWHLPDGSVLLHHTPQCRQGTKASVNSAWWHRKFCGTKLCPLCQMPNQWPFFLLCLLKGASPAQWPHLLWADTDLLPALLRAVSSKLRASLY